MDQQLCVNCNKCSNTKDGLVFVIENDSIYCSACYINQYSLKKTSIHEDNFLANPNTSLICSTHNKAYELFCISCSILLCSKCIIHHRLHEFLDIEETQSICESFYESFSNNSLLLQSSANALFESIKLQENHLATMRSSIENIKSKEKDNKTDFCNLENIEETDGYSQEKQRVYEYYHKIIQEIVFQANKSYRLVQDSIETIGEEMINTGKKLADCIDMKKEFENLSGFQLIQYFYEHKHKLSSSQAPNPCDYEKTNWKALAKNIEKHFSLQYHFVLY